MPDYYVALVKEYLELQGFFVKTETKYPILGKDTLGRSKKNWGDIDIIATKASPNSDTDILVAEVKAETQTAKTIKEIANQKFNNNFVTDKLTEIIGQKAFKKYLFCWSCKSEDRQVANKMGIMVKSYSEIIDEMLNIIKNKEGWSYEKDFPNLMLLQYLNDKGYLTKPKKSKYY